MQEFNASEPREIRPDLRWIPEVHHAHRDPWLCHEATSQPPLLPVDLRARGDGVRVAGQASDIVLTSADGARLRAHLARADGTSTDGIVICPDVRGLHAFYATLADRLAEAGVNAIAFDLFGRTLGVEVPAPSFYEGAFQTAPFRAHVDKTTPQQVQDDLRAAGAYLRSNTPARRVFATGFCFGGRVAFNASAEQPDLSGVIGFYGVTHQRTPEDTDAPILRVAQMRAPILGLFGGADQGISMESKNAFDGALGAVGLAHKLITYDGAPHSFFDRTFAEHAAACDDAWRRILAFIRTGDPTAT